MKNFEFHNPTKIYFGTETTKKLGTLLKDVGKRVLLVYGRSSIKKIGLYSTVIDQLEAANIAYFELSGVKPNPRIETVRKGAKMCKENNIDVVLGVGGGSVIDCSKGIALGAKYDGDPWDIYMRKETPKAALPVVSILTLSATGTEMNGNSVITNLKEKKKKGFGSILSYPVFSILDPTHTYSVSKHQTGCGIVDSLTHVYEFYFSQDDNYLNNRICESIMKTVIHYGPIALKDPNNYEARSNLMFSSTLALNGLTGFGKDFDGYNHTTEHVLSAYWDIAHGDGLAITAPHWMSYILDKTTVDKFYEFAVNVWGIKPGKDRMKVANQGIRKVFDFYESLGMPLYLKDVNITDPDLDLIAEEAVTNNALGKFKVLTKQDIKNILKNAL
ncbi:MAG: iron-containing alcohol dehydrogenase [Candidatus Izimaplasma sp.]|nr:iron-containing alcohol dehydrogenase [Candidatus Izimaplasma bacterium]